MAASPALSWSGVGSSSSQCSWSSHHVVSWKQLLQKLRLFVLDCFNDEFIIAGHIEEGTTSPRVAEFNQRLIAEGVLGPEKREQEVQRYKGMPNKKSTTDAILKKN